MKTKKNTRIIPDPNESLSEIEEEKKEEDDKSEENKSEKNHEALEPSRFE